MNEVNSSQTLMLILHIYMASNLRKP